MYLVILQEAVCIQRNSSIYLWLAFTGETEEKCDKPYSGWSITQPKFELHIDLLMYVVYSERSWTELVEGHVREGGLLTLASPTR
jgi:hypothetical protein